MLPDRVSNPGPLTYESGALPIGLSSPASVNRILKSKISNGHYSAKNVAGVTVLILYTLSNAA